MASSGAKTDTAPPISFPPPVFSSLNPALYLSQHLSLSPASRPSSRAPSSFSTPTLHASAPLTHAFGSCVARSGDTAAVAAVRAEILDVKDIPTEPTKKQGESDSDVINRLCLLVPNVEVATGAGRNFLPGGAPGTVAQSAAWRIKELLIELGMVPLKQLEIKETAESKGDVEMMDVGDAQEEEKIMGYWTLYIDVTLISHAGSILPVIWAAVLGALRTVYLPVATFSTQYDTILCSSKLPPVSLKVIGMPLISTFGVFEPSRHKGLSGKSGPTEKGWILADPDEFEEEICDESVLVVVDCSDAKRGTRVRRIDKSGGGFVDRSKMMGQILKLAVRRWGEWNAVLEEIGDED